MGGVSVAEAHARRMNRWTWAWLVVAGAGFVPSGASSAFLALAALGLMGAWASGALTVVAKGYSFWLALLGPWVAVALPSLHPVFERLEGETHARKR